MDTEPDTTMQADNWYELTVKEQAAEVRRLTELWEQIRALIWEND